MKKQISTIMVLLCLSSLILAEIPYGFIEISKAKGITLYKKDYAGGKPDYIHIIDLSQGAQVQFLYNKILQEDDSPKIPRDTLKNIWERFMKNNSKAFSITNGQFFSTNDSPTPLAFPLKVNGKIVSLGYGDQEYPNQKLMLELWNEHADIVGYTHSNFQYSTAPNIIVALSEYADKGIKIYTGRTFVGIYDKNNDAKNEMILIFNSSFSTQLSAAEVLRSFGAQKIIMMDGGGSTQLITKGLILIDSNRPIPQTIGILEGTAGMK